MNERLNQLIIVLCCMPLLIAAAEEPDAGKLLTESYQYLETGRKDEALGSARRSSVAAKDDQQKVRAELQVARGLVQLAPD